MRLLYRTTIDDMVAVFLKAEIASERFGEKIISQLELDCKERSIVDTPDITNVSENAYRRQLLASYRAYVFEELPAHTVWYRALLSRDEVVKIRYIDYDYWNEISDNTRLPIVAAEAIEQDAKYTERVRKCSWISQRNSEQAPSFPILLS